MHKTYVLRCIQQSIVRQSDVRFDEGEAMKVVSLLYCLWLAIGKDTGIINGDNVGGEISASESSRCTHR
ncbi:hypothetical protein SAMN02745123_03110 [Desulforamulus aeronauticus DSM 10349]|uniref:Uncharacterized protein n=1 Tax=Desulforamulus aeronauticus DSM 10349 TaxID=1121421 RepID=A0A1M6V8K7_9FIRM|nr:hypothetical protein SAMN02745123_03110 [Desulforamulus aeronauticus DSM 10349]